MFALTREPIDAPAVRKQVEHPSCGAVLVFHGTVRNHTAGRHVHALAYEAYEAMALRQLQAVADEVREATGVHAIACTHRLGDVPIGEDAMVLAVASPHRAAALAATGQFIERLKQDVPIWKKEHFEGGAVWIGTADDPQATRAARDGTTS